MAGASVPAFIRPDRRAPRAIHQRKQLSPLPVIAQLVGIGLAVVTVTYLLGDWVASAFG
ncbi:MAG: hypothetical protein ACOYXR_09930 [Nitrospirota bacterium]